jgi:hypothetical protein
LPVSVPPTTFRVPPVKIPPPLSVLAETAAAPLVRIPAPLGTGE